MFYMALLKYIQTKSSDLGRKKSVNMFLFYFITSLTTVNLYKTTQQHNNKSYIYIYTNTARTYVLRI